jgi:hypothetical protein
MTEEKSPDKDTSQEMPPFFRTWKQLYVFVIIEFLLCLLLFIFVTYYFQ